MDTEPLIIDEAGEKPTAQFLAEAQAAKDAALMASLKRRVASEQVMDLVGTAEQEAFDSAFDHFDESGVAVDKDGFPLELTEVPDAEPEPVARVPMNRAERRQQVKYYAKVLAMTERQVPVVNATVIPKSKRRHRRAH